MAQRKFFITPEQLEKDYSEVGNIRKLADRYGVDHNIVSKNMKRFGITFNEKQWVDVPELERLIYQGWTSAKLSLLFDCSQMGISAIAREKKMPLRNSFHVGYISTSNGYKCIQVKGHPHQNNKGYVLEHRWVVEQEIGRFLTTEEIIHHIDRNKKNNHISNLVIMTRQEHIKLHWREGNPSLT
jgi:hypothetical protein